MGTIRPADARPIRHSVHPHGRGDNFLQRQPDPHGGGSPPRAWGQFPPAPARSTWRRFTPTGVGTMGMLSNECRTTLVHPHGRGDNERFGVVWSRVDGSPPRVWGQFNAARSSQSKPRFTPTGVGTIRTKTTIPPSTKVHPHGRGDNPPPALSQHSLFGSPPRAWGQSPVDAPEVAASRFTPTGVGTIATATVTTI